MAKAKSADESAGDGEGESFDEPVLEGASKNKPAADSEEADDEPADKEAAGKEAAAKPADKESAAKEADKPADEAAAKSAEPADKATAASEAQAPAQGGGQASSAKSEWPMWGGSPDRNMVSDASPVSLDFELEKGNKNLLWTSNLGSQTYGNPVVSGGHVYVGTNNGAGYVDKYPAKTDLGVLLCFEEKTGSLLWQLSREKLAAGRVNDWPLQGICSVPEVKDDRVYVVTNRCELMCLDAKGFTDGKNDGEYQDEVDSGETDADIIWSLDMIEELGVFPHNLATSSPVIYDDMIYILTSNGVDEAHLQVPSPRAPCFLAVNIKTGEVEWEHNQPFDSILHGQWASPCLGKVNGRMLVFFPGGDGWMYAHDAKSGDEVWKFDLNPKDSIWELGGAGTRNSIIATPVFVDNSVIIAVGQDPEHGEGVGHMWRIDATKEGDVSEKLGDAETEGEPNPNSGVIWHYGGIEEGGDEPMFRRTMSTVAVKDGLLFAADLSGYVHCLDFKTGERHWQYDLLSGVWGSPLLVDGKVFLGNEDGTLTIFKADKEKAEVLAEKSTINYSSIYSTPTFANGNMYLSDRTRLYAVKVSDGEAAEEKASDKKDDEASEDEASGDEAADDKAADDKAAEDNTSDKKDDEASANKATDDEASDGEKSDDKASDDEAADDKKSDDEASDDEESEDSSE